MDRFVIRHKSGWVACSTWSASRAASWLAEFNPALYTDKTLRVEDFEVIDRQAVA